MNIQTQPLPLHSVVLQRFSLNRYLIMFGAVLCGSMRFILTIKRLDNILCSLAAHQQVGFGTPFKLGLQRPLIEQSNAVFLCPSKIKAVSIRLFSVMVGCIGQAQAWPFSKYGSSNLIQPATQRLEPTGSGLHLHKLGVTAMNTSTDEIRLQNPQNNYQKSYEAALHQAKIEDSLNHVLKIFRFISETATEPDPEATAEDNLRFINCMAANGFNAVHELKNLLGIVSPAEKQGGAA